MFEDSAEIKEYVNAQCVKFLTEEVADAIESAIDDGEFEREINFLDKAYQAKELIRLNKHYKKMVTSVVEMGVRSAIISTQLGTAGVLSSIIGPPPPEILEKLPQEIQDLLNQMSSQGPSVLDEFLKKAKEQSSSETKDVKDDWFAKDQNKSHRFHRDFNPENN